MAATKRNPAADAAALQKNQAAYETLKKVRASKTVALKPTPMLRTELVGPGGKTQPFNLRYYQVQGIYHLLTMKRMVLGDGTGLGKTVQVIGFLCYIWSKEHDNKAIVVSPKSALRQWASEIERFSTGIKTYVVSGSLEERKRVYKEFAEHKTGPGEDKAVLILNYAILVRDWNYGSVKPLLPNGQPDPKTPVSPGLLDQLTAGLKSPIVIYDECVAFKNVSTKTWQTCRFLSDRADRVYGLTATLLKNTLMEGFAIYKCIFPSVFTTKTKFLEEYCVVKLQPVGGGRKIPIVVGYRNLDHFRQRIDPYFLGRPKHVVSDELPTLITREVIVEMKPVEVVKYREALSGVLELGDGEVKDYEEHKAFVALTYCQQVVDSLTLLKFTEGAEIDLDMFHEESAVVDDLGSKEQALVDLLTEDFDGEKVIVYTRFSSLVPRLQAICEKIGIKSVAITGQVQDTVKNPARQKAQQAFQDPDSEFRVIFITDAGSEAINLQAASAMIFYDAPWSWGNYVQLLGRPIRIGSIHQHVVAVHLVSERPGKGKDRKTIDNYTLELLEKKKDLVDKVLGESAVGALDFGTGASFTKELVNNLRSHA
jgi:SNF2 family DNA or RNA helicase